MTKHKVLHLGDLADPLFGTITEMDDAEFEAFRAANTFGTPPADSRPEKAKKSQQRTAGHTYTK